MIFNIATYSSNINQIGENKQMNNKYKYLNTDEIITVNDCLTEIKLIEEHTEIAYHNVVRALLYYYDVTQEELAEGTGVTRVWLNKVINGAKTSGVLKRKLVAFFICEYNLSKLDIYYAIMSRYENLNVGEMKRLGGLI